MNRSLGKGAWKGLQLLGLALTMVATQHLGSGGIRSAQACTGGAPSTGWGDVEVDNPDALERVPIATDGFVLLRALLREQDLEAETPGAWVRVTNDSGQELPGQLRVLGAIDDGELRRVYLGWQSDQTLSIGSVVELTAGERDGAGGAGHEAPPGERVELEVVGEPTPLPVPTARLTDWLTVRHAVGELFDCQTYVGCGADLARAPAHEVRLLGVGLVWSVPRVTGMVAWEARAETTDPGNGDLALFPYPIVISGLRTSSSIEAGVVAFAEDAIDHCAVLVVKDLWTGEEKRSDPLCGTPTTPQLEERPDHDMAWCEAPPVPEAFELWCQYNADDPVCEGVGTAGAPGVPPVRGPVREIDEPTGPSAPAGNGDEPSESDDPAQAPRLSRGCGCQLAPAGGGIALTTVSVTILLGLLRRRRRVTVCD